MISADTFSQFQGLLDKCQCGFTNQEAERLYRETVSNNSNFNNLLLFDFSKLFSRKLHEL